MRRALSALQEWLQLRARVREEYQFHLDRAAAEFRSPGMSPRAANQQARVRFGSRRNMKIARRELGGDWAGLIHLFGAHRVLAPAWPQPMVLLAAIALIFVLSPSPRQVVNNVIVRMRKVEDPGAVFLSVAGRSPWSGGGITAAEFRALRSMATVTEVGPYHGLYARARAARGATLGAIESEAREKTGNRHFVVNSISRHTEIAIAPSQGVWVFIALYGVFFLFRYASQFGTSRCRLWRWLLYGAGLAGLHAVASLAAWAFVVQMWSRRQFTFEVGGMSFAVLFVAYLCVAAIQCRYWWIDLRQRCPICLDRLIMPWTQGAAGRVLLNPVITESICAHGHGVLVESRWTRQFRHEESPFEGLVGV